MLYADASQPSPQPGDAPQPGRRPPAGDPDRHGRGWFDQPGAVEELDPLGRQRPGAQQPAQDAQRLLEPRPAVVERHPRHGVVRRRRAGADAGDHPAGRERGQRGERGGELGGSPQRGQRDRRGEVHPAGAIGDRGEEGRPVEPRPVEGEVVVGADRCQPEVAGGVDDVPHAADVGTVAARRDLRQVCCHLHPASVPQEAVVGVSDR